MTKYYDGSQHSVGSVNYSPHNALIKKIYQQSPRSRKHIVSWHILQTCFPCTPCTRLIHFLFCDIQKGCNSHKTGHVIHYTLKNDVYFSLWSLEALFNRLYGLKNILIKQLQRNHVFMCICTVKCIRAMFDLMVIFLTFFY